MVAAAHPRRAAKRPTTPTIPASTPLLDRSTPPTTYSTRNSTRNSTSTKGDGEGGMGEIMVQLEPSEPSTRAVKIKFGPPRTRRGLRAVVVKELSRIGKLAGMTSLTTLFKCVPINPVWWDSGEHDTGGGSGNGWREGGERNRSKVTERKRGRTRKRKERKQKGGRKWREEVAQQYCCLSVVLTCAVALAAALLF